jgi:hypothetical protein
MADGDRIEFRMLDHTSVGDGTTVKVKVSLERVGVATNYRNPDGTAHYAVNTAAKVYVIPSDKKFTMPKSQVAGNPQPDRHSQPPSHIT